MYAITKITNAFGSADPTSASSKSFGIGKYSMVAASVLLAIIVVSPVATATASNSSQANPTLVTKIDPVVVQTGSSLQEVRDLIRARAQKLASLQRDTRVEVQQQAQLVAQQQASERQIQQISALEFLTNNAQTNAPALAAARASLASLADSTTQNYDGAQRSPWLDENGLNANGWFLLDVIASAPAFGLAAERFHHTQLERLGVENWNDATANAYNQLLTSAFKLLLSDLGSGRVNPRKSQSSWYAKPAKINAKSMLEQLSSGSSDVASLLTPYLSEWHRFEPMVKAIEALQQTERTGGWVNVPEGEKLELGSNGFRVDVLKSRLQASGDYHEGEIGVRDTLITIDGQSSASTLVSSEVAQPDFDATLEAAVMRFQRRHGLVDDGIVGPATLRELNVSIEDRIKQSQANLERMRWIPANLGEHHIITNIPNYRMNVVRNGEVMMDMRVVVGKKKHMTPVFSADMSHLVVNPTWLVPNSIANKELVPKERANPGHLQRSGFEFLANNGSGLSQIDTNSISYSAWHQDKFPYRIRQRAGKNNALGKVKFMLPNPYSIYLHDTPAKSLFKKQDRAFSHGCVRLAEPKKLANYLLNDKGWSDGEILSAFEKKKTKTVNFNESIPNHIIYLTSWVERDGSLQFRKDIYQQDKRLIKHLVAENDQRQNLINTFGASDPVLATLE